MGKGIALMFKRAFPDNYRAYCTVCDERKVNVGHMFVYERATADSPRWIINFPTKMHWRNPSRLEWIREGLQDLPRVTREHEIRSMAIPPLGAGLGGLDWNDVRREIEQAFSDFDGTDVIVYEPLATSDRTEGKGLDEAELEVKDDAAALSSGNRRSNLLNR